jgi:hypothetical protein
MATKQGTPRQHRTPPVANAVRGVGESSGRKWADFVVSDASIVDLDGDIVASDSWDLSYWKRFGCPWLFGHSHGHPLPIGTSKAPSGEVSFRPSGDQTIARIWFDDDDFSQEVWRKCKSGYFGASVAFSPIEGQPNPMGGRGHLWRKVMLTEISVVVSPANQNAVLAGVSKGLRDRFIYCIGPYCWEKGMRRKRCTCGRVPCRCGKATQADFEGAGQLPRSPPDVDDLAPGGAEYGQPQQPDPRFTDPAEGISPCLTLTP